jgi:hypothetical protein
VATKWVHELPLVLVVLVVEEDTTAALLVREHRDKALAEAPPPTVVRFTVAVAVAVKPVLERMELQQAVALVATVVRTQHLDQRPIMLAVAVAVSTPQPILPVVVLVVVVQGGMTLAVMSIPGKLGQSTPAVEVAAAIIIRATTTVVLVVLESSLLDTRHRSSHGTFCTN